MQPGETAAAAAATATTTASGSSSSSIVGVGSSSRLPCASLVQSGAGWGGVGELVVGGIAH